jgi:endonuclease III
LSKKSEQLSRLLEKVKLRWPIPKPIEGFNLLEQGLAAVVQRRHTREQAIKAVEQMRKSYSDWNELRVSQAQEVAKHLGMGAKGLSVARDACAYLQEVFQYSHGLSLEFLRDDPAAAQRFVYKLDLIGLALAHHLMQLALPSELPVTGGLSRVLDRLGFIARTSSIKKARGAIEPLAEGLDAGLFATRLGEVASRWCDARKPACHECVLVDDCRHGKKVFKEWKVQQERQAVQRARDAARAAAQQKKDEEKRRREAERVAKKAAQEAAKKAREAERKARIEAKKAAALKAKLEHKRKLEEERAKQRAALEQKRKEALKQKQKAEAERRAKQAAAKKHRNDKRRAKKPARKH